MVFFFSCPPGVLGLMVGWRAYYTTNLDWFANVSDADKQRYAPINSGFMYPPTNSGFLH